MINAWKPRADVTAFVRVRQGCNHTEQRERTRKMMQIGTKYATTTAAATGVAFAMLLLLRSKSILCSNAFQAPEDLRAVWFAIQIARKKSSVHTTSTSTRPFDSTWLCNTRKWRNKNAKSKEKIEIGYYRPLPTAWGLRAIACVRYIILEQCTL